MGNHFHAGLLLFLLALPSMGLGLSPDQVIFSYQKLTEPFESAPCTHVVSSENPLDWQVECRLGQEKHRFSVHLAVSFYPKTTLGTSAYEVLYWVTDSSDQKPRFDSSSLWIHNSHEQNQVRVFELSQGIEEDKAYLHLVVNLVPPARESK